MADRWGTKVCDTIVIPELIEVNEILKNNFINFTLLTHYDEKNINNTRAPFIK